VGGCAGSWRKLPNEELHDFYALPNIIRVIKKEYEMGGAWSTHWRMRSAKCILFFFGKRDGKRTLEDLSVDR